MRPVTQDEALARFSSLAGRDLIVLATMVGGIVTEWLDRQERAKPAHPQAMKSTYLKCWVATAQIQQRQQGVS